MKSPSEQCRDKYLYLQEPELLALKHCISQLPENSVCVNLGAGFGTSGLAFIESDRVGQLFTIDIYKLMSENGLGSLEFELGQFALYGYDKDPRYHQILGDGAEVGKGWNREIDMIFIDADHSYPHAFADISAWMWRIKDGGVMAFHDYDLPGVKQAVDELLTGKHKIISTAKAFIAFRIGRVFTWETQG